MQFSNTAISIATISDVPAINNLLNQAYRGESSRQGWTTEANIIEGETRTDESDLEKIIHQPGSVFLTFNDNTRGIIGCVNLKKEGRKMYLGMFSVSPRLQGGGIGKKILQASEEYAGQIQCDIIYMSVISVRKEIIDWYIRHGYYDTGTRKPFVEDGLTGKHLQPLEFMILEKKLIG
ncbi:MAG TPA: GNAT family N-acetyltransferase [Ferruginibacter sp.]|nr:GNAT family N-acetyltransferase [Ferruginibacter sp.]